MIVTYTDRPHEFCQRLTQNASRDGTCANARGGFIRSREEAQQGHQFQELHFLRVSPSVARTQRVMSGMLR